jgi:hypothetical protein
MIRLYHYLAFFLIVFSLQSQGAAKDPADSTKLFLRTVDSLKNEATNRSASVVSATSDTTMKSAPYAQNSFKKSTIKVIKYLSVFILGFILGGLAVYFFVRRHFLGILGEDRDKYLSEIKDSRNYRMSVLALFDLLKQRKDKYKNECEQQVNELNDELAKRTQLSSTLKALEKRNTELTRTKLELENILNNPLAPKRVFNNNNNMPGPLKIEPRTAPSNRRLLSVYFSIPESDGAFSVEKGVPFFDDRKYYKIEYPENSDKGVLHFLSGQFDLKAIDNIDYYLMPVCDIDNISDRNSATKILQKEPGTVVRYADKWVIDKDKKVKVKLI